MTPEELLLAEQVLDLKFRGEWEINPYLSPSEKMINKPILPETNPATNRMGHPRNWPGPDTPLVQAIFTSYNKTVHTGVFTEVNLAIEWLLRQDPSTGMVKV